MNFDIERLLERYAAWLIERLEAGESPTCYLFDKVAGGNETANDKLLKLLEPHEVTVEYVTDWPFATEKQVARTMGGPLKGKGPWLV